MAGDCSRSSLVAIRSWEVGSNKNWPGDASDVKDRLYYYQQGLLEVLPAHQPRAVRKAA